MQIVIVIKDGNIEKILADSKRVEVSVIDADFANPLAFTYTPDEILTPEALKHFIDGYE